MLGSAPDRRMKTRDSRHGRVVHAVISFVACCSIGRPTSAFHLRRTPRSSSSVARRFANDVMRPRHAGVARRTDVDVASASRLLLAYYPSDETLSERFESVMDEWDNLRKDGIGKFLSDEFELAERLMLGNAESAVMEANDVMGTGEVSSSGGEEGEFLLREGFHVMATAGEKIAGEMRAVRQLMDVSRAARGVEGAAEDVVGADLLVERDLARVVDDVVSSLKEADEVVQSAMAAVASSRGGLTDSARGDLTERLEARARDIEESITAADSVARKAKEIAAEDRRVMFELERTGDRLSGAIETTESLTEELRGTEGGADVDSISDTAEQTADIVREFEKSAEDISDAVGQKVIAEADAVIAMDEKASDSVDAVRAAGASVRDVDSSYSLRAALTRDAEEIRGDMNTAERLAEAIRLDASNDQVALDALESGSRDVDSLIDAMNGAVNKAADAVAIGGEALSGNSVVEAVERIYEEMEEVEDSMSDVKEAAEKCQDNNVQNVAEEIEESELFEPIEEDVAEDAGEDVEGGVENDVEIEGKKSDSDDVEISEEGGVRSEAAHEHEEEENESESEVESDVEMDSGGGDGREVDAPAHENVRDNIEASSSEVKDKSFDATMNGIEDQTSEKLHGTRRESMKEELSETIASGGDDDVGHFDDADEVLKNMPEPSNNIISSMNDAAAEPTFQNSGDALASVDPAEDFESVVSNTASVASEVGDSVAAISESAHDMATWTTHSVAEGVTMFSTFFI